VFLSLQLQVKVLNTKQQFDFCRITIKRKICLILNPHLINGKKKQIMHLTWPGGLVAV